MLVLCPESSVFYFGNLSCRRNAAKCTKTRISKSEIRNNIKIRMFKIQNKDGLVLLFSVFVIDIFVIRNLFRASIFEFRISPPLSSGLTTPNQGLFQIAISGQRIYETGH